MSFSLGSIFNSAAEDQGPVSTQDTIYNVNVSGKPVRLMSADYGLRTGDFRLSGAEDFHVDLSQENAFTDAFFKIEDNVMRRIEKDPQLQKLLHEQANWSKADLELYEKNLAAYVSEEMDKIPGLGKYRNTTDGKKDYQNKKNITDLSELSVDIENNTSTLRFDCAVMSVVEGMLNQKITNALLPEDSLDGDFKRAGQYRFISGGTLFEGDENVGRHMVVMTPGGGIIDATVDPDTNKMPYEKIVSGSFDQYLKGQTLVTEKGNTYGGRDVEQVFVHENARNLANDMLKGERDEGRTYSREDLWARHELDGYSVVEAKDQGLIVVASKTKKGKKAHCELKAYQLHDEGTPQEGYSIVGYRNSEILKIDQKESLSYTYTDSLTKERFKFDIEFDGDNITSKISQHNKRLNAIGIANVFNKVAENTAYTPAKLSVEGTVSIDKLEKARNSPNTNLCELKELGVVALFAVQKNEAGEPKNLHFQIGKNIENQNGETDIEVTDVDAEIIERDLKEQGKAFYSRTIDIGGETIKFDINVTKDQATMDVYQYNEFKDWIPGNDGFTRIAQSSIDLTRQEPDRGFKSNAAEAEVLSFPAADPESVKALQAGLRNITVNGERLYNGPVSGEWNPESQQALEALIIKAQVSDSYQAHAKAGSVRVDGLYGPKTEQALNQMRMSGEIDHATVTALHKLQSSGDLRELYGPDNVRQNLSSAMKDDWGHVQKPEPLVVKAALAPDYKDPLSGFNGFRP